MVWSGGTYGHVAIARAYTTGANGGVTILVDEQNAGGKMIDDPITDKFGSQTSIQLPVSDLDRGKLKFKGLILPVKNH